MKSTAWANDLLKLLYQNVAAALIGDASGLQPSGAPGVFYLSLHSASPGVGGTQSTNEIAYTGYGRHSVARDNTHWTVSANQVVNALTEAFAACTGGSATATYVACGTAVSGAGKLLNFTPLVAAWYDATGNASTDKLTAPGHALSVNDVVQVIGAVGGTIPGGLAVSTTYYVKSVSGNDIILSTTLGGTTLDITANGACLIGKIAPLSISSGITPQVSPSGIVHVET